MNCNCQRELGEKLKAKNIRLSCYTLIVDDLTLKSRFFAQTEWIDKAKAPKGQKNNYPPMLTSFCPFCGCEATKKDAK